MAILVPNFQLAEQIGKTVEIDARTVGELLDKGVAQYGAPFAQSIASAAIVVNGRSISYLQGRQTPLGATDQVWLVLPAGGG